MMVESSSRLMQYHLFEQNTQDISVTDNLDNEIECPRCHDVMTLFSGFDFLYYQCQECHFPLYTSSNQFGKLWLRIGVIQLVILKAPIFQKLKNFEWIKKISALDTTFILK